jgi:glycosyltransferase involved in cell wall biosynthesis
VFSPLTPFGRSMRNRQFGTWLCGTTIPHLVHVFPSFDFGGMELRMSSIINALGSELRHTIVPLNGCSNAARLLNRDLDVAVLHQTRGHWGPLRLRAYIRSLNPDLLLTYNWGAFDAVIGMAMSPFCPVLHNECGFAVEESTRIKQRRALIRRMFLPRVRRTIVVSRTLLRLLTEQVRLKPTNVRLIRTGVDTDAFHPRRNIHWRHSQNISDDTVVFGFVGRLSPEKDLSHLLTLFATAQMPNTRLVFVGDGSGRTQLNDAAERLRIRSRIVFVGHVDNPAPYFNAFDAFVMHSVTEQTSNSLLQAMASGLPCLCTNVGDTRDILGDPRFVFDCHDADGYRSALQNLAASSELRLSAGVANRRRCIEEFPFSRMVNEYRDEYWSACENFSSAD